MYGSGNYEFSNFVKEDSKILCFGDTSPRTGNGYSRTYLSSFVKIAIELVYTCAVVVVVYFIYCLFFISKRICLRHIREYLIFF